MPTSPTRLMPRNYWARPILSTRLAHLLYLGAGLILGATLALITTGV